MCWGRWCRAVVVMVVVTAVVTAMDVGEWTGQDYNIPSIVPEFYRYLLARAKQSAESSKHKNGGITDYHVNDPFLDVFQDRHTALDKEPELNNSSRSGYGGVTCGEELLPRPDECGLRSLKTGRVFFGEDAHLSAYPWMALLGFKDPSKPTWLCGGTLINDRYVVSAGHCLCPSFISKPSVVQLVTIRLGEHNLDTNPDCAGFRGSRVCAPSHLDFTHEEYIIHEDYIDATKANDISLIRLDKPVTFSTSIRPVCLPPAGLDVEEFLQSREALVAGWGTMQNGSDAKVLQKALVPRTDKENCDESYSLTLSEGQLCFGGKGKVDSCYGDSGGPIMQARPGTARFTLLGVVSFGKSQCGIPGTPAVYTNVSHYRHWIVQNLKP